MFIGSMTNKRIRAGCQTLSLFCGFPQGHNGNSAVQHQTLICYLMPMSLINKNYEAWSLPLYCMVTKHADRQSKSRQPSLFQPQTPHLSSRQTQSALPTGVPARSYRAQCSCTLAHTDVCIHTYISHSLAKTPPFYQD